MGYEVDLRDNYAKVHEKFFPPPPAPPRLSEKATREALETFKSKAEALENQLSLVKARLTVVERALNPVIVPVCPLNPHIITLEKIIQTVCKTEHISRAIVMGAQRHAALALIRQIMFYLASTLTMSSLPRIGHALKRDHTTVLHGVRKLKALRLVDSALDERLKAYEAALTADAELA